MKRIFYILFFTSLFFANKATAQVLSEGEVIESLIRSLQYKDNRNYLDLFPQTDTIADWVLQYADKTSESYNRMKYLKDNYEAKIAFDSSIREEAEKGFKDFVKKGSALGIHWDQIVLVRFELEKIRRGRDLITEKISPLRFLGYVFIKDLLNRKTYGFTVFDIMQVNNMWYGGELAYIFEAATKEDYEKELAAEKKRIRNRELGIVDSSENKTASFDENDERRPKMKEILERKFYKGKFDSEITVQLYVQHIKGNCPEITCSWEALFKFGDQDDFVRMEVSRNAEGKWLFSEELGGMELKLDGKIYTGAYASASDKTEYEVKLIETDISLKKVEALDQLLDEIPEEQD
ncbi:MAG TPA: hypothetical protein PL009_07265 [Flavipsychrobacter sp.]|nr:hypothetical protein [Flavipsychrobacter sp.]